MNNFLKISLLVLLLSFGARAQYRLKGTVIDAESSQALPLATIYLNTTTVGTSSALDGSFSLQVPAGKFELVVSYTGYEAAYFSLPLQPPDSALVFYLRPLAVDLEEINVESKRDPSWYQHVAVFKKNFIGESTEAQRTSLRNETKLIVDYNEQSRQLVVSGMEALELENEALGYDMAYQLQNFFYDQKEGLVSYAGFPFYREMEGNERQLKRWEKARQEAYEGSFMHFTRILTAGGNPQDAGFEIRPIRAEQRKPGVLVNGQAPSYPKEVTLDSLLMPYQYFMSTQDGRFFFTFQGKIEITYTKKRADRYYRMGSKNPTDVLRISTIQLQQYPAELDVNGSLMDPLAALFGGYWGWEKVANMLPLDYRPIEN